MVAWTTVWEGEPANTDQVSSGDDEIVELKVTIRENIVPEHDMGDAAGYADSGRHNPGSARAYFQAAAPTFIQRPNNATQNDKNGSNALDAGRLWVDSDADNKLYAYDAAWEAVSAHPAILFDRAAYSGALVALLAAGVPGDLAALVGGSGATANIAMVTVPAEGVYNVHVTARVTIENTGAAVREAQVDLMQDIAAAGYAVVDTVDFNLDDTLGNVATGNLEWYVEGATNGSAYSYKLQGESSGATMNYGGAASPIGTNRITYINAKLEPAG
jgi:hypothetical protein